MAHNASPDPGSPSPVAAATPPGAGGGQPVFVYGTLKRGHSNHHWLEGAILLGERQLRGVQLFDLGPFPMAVPAAADPDALVCGELYRVSEGELAQLDLLEGCPRLYGRHWLRLEDDSQAWVYLGRPRQVRHARLLADGIWRGRSRMGP